MGSGFTDQGPAATVATTRLNITEERCQKHQPFNVLFLWADRTQRGRVPLMECEYAQGGTAETWTWKKAPPPKLTVLVMVQGKRVQGLLDSGCSQAVVQAFRVEDDNSPKNTIYLHSDVKTYLSQRLPLTRGAHPSVVMITPSQKSVLPHNHRQGWLFF